MVRQSHPGAGSKFDDGASPTLSFQFKGAVTWPFAVCDVRVAT